MVKENGQKNIIINFIIKIKHFNSTETCGIDVLKEVEWNYPLLPRIGEYISARMLSKWKDAESLLDVLEEDWRKYREIYAKELMYEKNLGKDDAFQMGLKKCLDNHKMKVINVCWFPGDKLYIDVNLEYEKLPF